jgi:hypothetical protein
MQLFWFLGLFLNLQPLQDITIQNWTLVGYSAESSGYAAAQTVSAVFPTISTIE